MSAMFLCVCVMMIFAIFVSYKRGPPRRKRRENKDEKYAREREGEGEGEGRRERVAEWKEDTTGKG